MSSRKKKPKNRFEEFVKPKFDDFVNYIKDALKDIDNPFEDVSFAVGTGVERAFKQMVKNMVDYDIKKFNENDKEF